MTPLEASQDRRRAWGLGCGSLVLMFLALSTLAWMGPDGVRPIAFSLLLLAATVGYFSVVLTALARASGLGRGALAKLEMLLRAWVARFAKDPEGLWIHWAGRVRDAELGLACLERAGPMGPRGAFELGLALSEGPAKDLALPWFRRAAEQGHGSATLHLAESLRWGHDGVRDVQEAERWEKRVASMGPVQRQTHSALRGGEDRVGQARAKAEDILDLFWAKPWAPWLCLAAFALLLPAVGLYLAAFVLVCAPLMWIPLRFINGPDRRMGGALKRLVERAEGGEAAAASELARLYLTGGQGLPKDALSARLWFQRAAEAGDPEAMVSLADMLDSGHGVIRDPKQARQWFERAAQAGHERAGVWLAQHPGL